MDMSDGDLGSIGNVPWFTRLWASVLRRASIDWVLYKNHSDQRLRRIGKQADAWIFRDEDTGFGSFDFICDVLGTPVEVIRGKIRRLTEDEVRRLRGMEFGDT